MAGRALCSLRTGATAVHHCAAAHQPVQSRFISSTPAVREKRKFRHLGEVLHAKQQAEEKEDSHSWSGTYSFGSYGVNRHTEQYIVDQTDPVLVAQNILSDDNQGCSVLYVRDSFRRVLVGKLSDRDYARKVALSGLDVQLPIEMIMRPGLFCSGLMSSVESALHLAMQLDTRQICAIDESSLPDVLQKPFAQQLNTGMPLRGVPESAFMGVLSVKDLLGDYHDSMIERGVSYRKVFNTAEEANLGAFLEFKLDGMSAADVYSISEDSTVHDFLDKLATFRNNVETSEAILSTQLVTDKHGAPVGFVSERHCVTRLPTAESGVPDVSLPVSSIMTPMADVERLKVTDTFEDIISGLDIYQTGSGNRYSLPVFDGDNFAGIIGLTDLVRALDDPESMRLVKSGIASASWGV